MKSANNRVKKGLKMTQYEVLLSKEFDDEEIAGIFEALLDAMDDDKVTITEDGFAKGTFKVTLEYKED